MDIHTPLQRHANMAAIHGKNTELEMVVRHWLWRLMFRYRPTPHWSFNDRFLGYETYPLEE